MHLAELYPDQALRFCGLSECLRLGGPARLVSRFIYILLGGFEGRVVSTSTTGSPREFVETNGSH